MASFWRHGQRPTTREALVKRLRAVSANVDALRAKANRQEKTFLSRKTVQGMANAEEMWLDTERQLEREQRTARRLMEEVAAGDRRKREAEPPRGGKRWRYHPRFSSNSVKGKFNQVEIFFQRRDGARMTEHEVLQAVSDLSEGEKRSDLVVGSVRWGKRLHKRSSATRHVASDFWSLIRYGEFDTIGEEELYPNV